MVNQVIVDFHTSSSLAPGDIKCIWFYRKDECDEVSKLIEDIVNDLKQGKVQ